MKHPRAFSRGIEAILRRSQRCRTQSLSRRWRLIRLMGATRGRFAKHGRSTKKIGKALDCPAPMHMAVQRRSRDASSILSVGRTVVHAMHLSHVSLKNLPQVCAVQQQHHTKSHSSQLYPICGVSIEICQHCGRWHLAAALFRLPVIHAKPPCEPTCSFHRPSLSMAAFD